MSASTTPLYLIPGVGADERLFAAHRAVRDVRPVPRIEPAHRRERLAQYAARLAAVFRPDVPFDLGGASFGGMLALELARHLAPRQVFLFSSCRSPRSVAPLLRALNVFSPIAPDWMLHEPRSVRPVVARWLGARSREHVELFGAMLVATPAAFIRWSFQAIASWDGVATLPMPVHHIHGARDTAIPARLVQADRVVAGAGHLLNLTHAEAVNDYLSSRA